MKKKPATIPSLTKTIRDQFRHWSKLELRGGTDPFYADGANMNLTRGHIFIEQAQLRKLCKQGEVPCPLEATRRPPRKMPEDYCAPLSKAGPCRKKRAAARGKKG